SVFAARHPRAPTPFPDTTLFRSLHAESPGGSTEAHDAKPELGEARDACLVRDSEPDLGWCLGADPVDAQGAEQADDAAGYPRTRDRKSGVEGKRGTPRRGRVARS